MHLLLPLNGICGIDTEKIEKIELPFNDIKSQEDHDRFVEIAKEAIGRELNSGKVIVSVAGGRKTMSVGIV